MSAKPYGKFAEVYDSLLDQQRFYDGYYQFIAKILGKLKFSPKSVLDLACGTGKLAEIFLRKGYMIEGLDLSREMLRIARKRGLKVHAGNMTRFNLRKKFDLVLCTFDALNYLHSLSEVRKCFGSVYSSLNYSGLFIFDFNSDYKIRSYLPKASKTMHYEVGNFEVVWSNRHMPGKWIADIRMIEKGGRRFHEVHVEKAYPIAAIRKLLNSAGFKVAGVYSDFEFNKVKRNSLKWFFVCRKRV